MNEVLSNLGDVGIIIGVLSLLVQVSPIKVNPWSWLFKQIGEAINGDIKKELAEVTKSVSKLDDKIEKMSNSQIRDKIENKRYRIIRFGDELRSVSDPSLISKDHYDQILNDIDDYEKYCAQHPDFRNNITQMTCDHVKSLYKKLFL